MCRILSHSPYNIENFVVGFQKKNHNKVCNMSVSWKVCGLDRIQGNIFCFFLKYLQKKKKRKEEQSDPTLVRPLRQRVLICVRARAH